MKKRSVSLGLKNAAVRCRMASENMPAKKTKSLKGKLLLDGGRLGGSFFHRTVVLVCEHNAKGAMGLVLNRPSENRLEDVFDRELPPRLMGEILYGGGPVQPAALSYLHGDPAMESANVIDRVSVGHDIDELLEIGKSWVPSRRLRVFAGYAGWSPLQLDKEMEREAWIVHPATPALVFDVPPADLWRHILRLSKNWEHRLLAEAPENLGWN